MCQPDFALLEPMCSNGMYISDYVCTNPNMTQYREEEMHISFPSGHTSFGFNAAMFIVLYLQQRMNWPDK
jgi:hypothetical protein